MLTRTRCPAIWPRRAAGRSCSVLRSSCSAVAQRAGHRPDSAEPRASAVRRGVAAGRAIRRTGSRRRRGTSADRGNKRRQLARRGGRRRPRHRRRGLGLTVDGYHLDQEHEDVGVVGDVASLVRHVHVCGPGRRPPATGDETYLMPLLSVLASIEYTGRCSIECRWADLASEAPRALETVRRAAEKAGLG